MCIPMLVSGETDGRPEGIPAIPEGIPTAALRMPLHYSPRAQYTVRINTTVIIILMVQGFRLKPMSDGLPKVSDVFAAKQYLLQHVDCMFGCCLAAVNHWHSTGSSIMAMLSNETPCLYKHCGGYGSQDSHDTCNVNMNVS